MKIIIVGAGFTGTQLAKRLIDEKNDIILIDRDEDIVRHVSNRLDCMVMQADGNSLATLQEAGIAEADALVAVTGTDELNMITCSLVNSLYPSVLKIARVRNYDYYLNSAKDDNSSKHLYGIDFMIHPDVEAAEAISAAIEHGAVTEVVDLENTDYELVLLNIEKHSPFNEQTVQSIRHLTDIPFLVAYIENNGVSAMPSGATVIHENDRVGLLTAKSNVTALLTVCGTTIREFRKIAILGAGKIGTSVAEKLVVREKTNILSRFLDIRKKITRKIVMIDPDDQLTKEAAERFPSVNVFRADIADEGIIEEENLSSYNLIIAASHNHEKNMISSAYLKSLGAERTVCLVASSSYATIARNIGIDVAVPIRDTIIDSIISHLRGKSVSSIHTISDSGLELEEIQISEKASVINKTLKEISEPGLFLILLYCPKDSDKYVIPDGNTKLEIGDKIILIVNTKDDKRIMGKFGIQ